MSTPSTPSSPLSGDDARRLGAEMGVSAAEVDAIEARLGRSPNVVELSVFAGMWSEHCSYKTTRSRLKELPKDGDGVLAGPGSHAGVIDVGEGWGLAFKIESHNHPSAVEPYQGAATGVGGILRDIVAQGARPCLVMDSLCFGDPDSSRTRHIRDGVVAGIAGYGNAFGVANVGGRTVFDKRYEGNPLVNALAAGLVPHDGMRTAQAKGIGNPVLYAGAATGRDGILGAAFASEELQEDTVEKRSHVQVGDPFTGKKLMEATLSYTREMGLIACQDMGATGLTCACTEMAEAGGVGVELWLDKVPLREERMAPEEILVSESQERFLFVIEAGKEREAVEHFESYGVHAVICGRVIDEDRFLAKSGDRVVVDLPASFVAEGCPEAHHPVADALPAAKPYTGLDTPIDLGAALTGLLAHPSIASKDEFYSRYDSTVGNRTVRGPGQAEAAVQCLPGSRAGYALTITGRGEVCAADPRRGAALAIGEAARNLACVGAEIAAITDGLNMGSPTDPVENLRLSETIAGLGDGLRALGIPVTGGNVSLYNESPHGAIPPTPMVGAVGRLADVTRVPGSGLVDGHSVFLIGDLLATPSFSVFGDLHSSSGRPQPSIDLDADCRFARFMVAAIGQGWVSAAKDAGAGGLGVSLAKLAIRGGVGAALQLPEHDRLDWLLFGEHPGQGVLCCDPKDETALQTLASSHSIPLYRAGIAGGRDLSFAPKCIYPVDELRRIHGVGAP